MGGPAPGSPLASATVGQPIGELRTQQQQNLHSINSLSSGGSPEAGVVTGGSPTTGLLSRYFISSLAGQPHKSTYQCG